MKLLTVISAVLLLNLSLPRTIGDQNQVLKLLQFVAKWKPSSDLILFTNESERNSLSNGSGSGSDSIKVNLSELCPDCCISIVADESLLLEPLLQGQGARQKELMIVFRADAVNGDVLKYMEMVNILEGVRRNQSHSHSIRSPTYIILQNSHISPIQYQLLPLPSNINISNLFLNSNLYLFIPSQNRDQWNILELYSLNSSLQINPVNVTQLGNKVATRSDFRRITVRATAPELNMTQGEIIWTLDNNKRPVLSGGFGVDIFKCFQHALNFEMSSIPTKGWASLISGTNRWNVGMAQEVFDGRADIGLAKTSILPYRATSLSYLIPIHALILTAFFRQPSISSVRNILLLPFNQELWLGFIATWILVVISMRILAFLRYRLVIEESTHEDTSETSESDDLIWCQSSFWGFGAICQQGSYITPHSIPLKIILYFGLFVGLIGYVAYSATLVSIFTTSTASIKSLEELLRSSMAITVDVDNGVATTLATKHSDPQITYSTTANLLIKKVSSGGNGSYLRALDGQAKLLSAPYAYLTFIDKFYTTIKSEYQKDDTFLCSQVTSFPVSTVPFRSGLFVAKGSAFKEFFNAKMLILITSGLLKHYVRNYEDTYTPICSQTETGTVKQGLGINDLFSAYLVILFGFVLATGLLFLERGLSWVHLKRVLKRFQFE